MADSTAARPAGAVAHLELVLPDGSRVPLDRPLTIGRGEAADVKLNDRTVSRTHARISVGADGPVVEDAGSSFGTMLSGARLTGPALLRAGAELRLGDVVLTVAAVPATTSPTGGGIDGDDASPGRTVVVPIDATILGLRQPGAGPGDGSLRPRLRSGWALKRLGAEEGEQRFLLRDLRRGDVLRMDAAEAAMLDLLDGQFTIAELLGRARGGGGEEATGRLIRLIARLADHGLIEGISGPAPATERPGRWRRVFAPRERATARMADYFPRAYRHWGRVLFSPLTATLLTLFALAGFGAFTYLIGARYGTPFVVAHRLLIGGAVFVAGRFALVALHELCHGLALAHYGRRTTRAGLRLVLIFPYAFVDTSEAYFEPRSHRIVISAAGPACDLTLGSLFSIVCALLPHGSLRDVFFQLAFGAYVGAFFNLNPFLDRDGYNILVDFLREPGLRTRARRQLQDRLSGASRSSDDSPVLARYAVAGLIWSAVGAGFTIVFSLRFYHRLMALAPHGLILTLFVVFYALLLIPVLAQLGLPLMRRARFGSAEVNRVIR